MTAVALGPGGEFDRVRAIARALGARARGLGDDCAVIPAGEGALVASTDATVQDVHFRLDWIGLGEAGWRASAAALSDLAAAGAEPVGLLAALVAPPGAAENDVVELMTGIASAGESVAAPVLGGDLSAGPAWIVTVTVLGRAARPVGRAGARAGDGIWVTGALGGARAALEAWRQNRLPAPEARRAFAAPSPRLAAGRWLATHGARAMLDLSDGLAGDAGHLAAASRLAVRLELDAVPVAPAAVSEARRLDLSPEQFAAEGGEDYELLAAMPAEFHRAGAADFEAACGLALTWIGGAVEGSGVLATLGGRPLALRGYDHFR